ncbi:lasso peptide biosynthesis B2 protein [Nocardiopsis sp. FR26]|uniref:lasso peptide biosynthesis B2 protein n=1 Tax=Nocardiopsis sp. FR26 TaxID=2605987 RepID=UPI0013578C21|nr:lasso peptide biosynthesis B2 protein [Nocardiopsis sp. FR26]
MSRLRVLLPPQPLTLRQRLAAHAAVAAARVLLWATRARPARLRRALMVLGRGAAPATVVTTAAAHGAVTTVSLRCASPHGCLLRSLATVLLCRTRGEQPVWRVGVRAPATSHAWVEAGGTPVGEHEDPHRIYTPIITVSAEGTP